MWLDLTGAQHKVYVVQTNPRAIERCLLMTTDPGDLVLDPTCGSGTTAYVAEQRGRRWITIDTNRVALALAPPTPAAPSCTSPGRTSRSEASPGPPAWIPTRRRARRRRRSRRSSPPERS